MTAITIEQLANNIRNLCGMPVGDDNRFFTKQEMMILQSILIKYKHDLLVYKTNHENTKAIVEEVLRELQERSASLKKSKVGI